MHRCWGNHHLQDRPLSDRDCELDCRSMSSWIHDDQIISEVVKVVTAADEDCNISSVVNEAP